MKINYIKPKEIKRSERRELIKLHLIGIGLFILLMLSGGTMIY